MISFEVRIHTYGFRTSESSFTSGALLSFFVSFHFKLPLRCLSSISFQCRVSVGLGDFGAPDFDDFPDFCKRIGGTAPCGGPSRFPLLLRIAFLPTSSWLTCNELLFGGPDAGCLATAADKMICACRCRALSLSYCFFSSEISRLIFSFPSFPPFRFEGIPNEALLPDRNPHAVAVTAKRESSSDSPSSSE